MKLINVKSLLAFMIAVLLVGCKTVNEGLDTRPSATPKLVASKMETEDKEENENRQIEEVPEVLAMIEESKTAELEKSDLPSIEPKKVLVEGSTSQICNDWKANRSSANTKWLGQNTSFRGRVTSLSHSTKYSDEGSMVMIDADKEVSLGVSFKHVQETLLFGTGQLISFEGALTEIKKASNGRCLFIIKDAVVSK